MARILLDSTVLIDALRGRPAAERVRAMRRIGDQPWVCVISIEEIWRGLRDRERTNARRLMRGLRLAPLGKDEGTLAGTWRRDHAKEGVTLHQADCLIAASAVGIDALLATGNPTDFPMTELGVEYWPVGE